MFSKLGVRHQQKVLLYVISRLDTLPISWYHKNKLRYNHWKKGFGLIRMDAYYHNMKTGLNILKVGDHIMRKMLLLLFVVELPMDH